MHATGRINGLLLGLLAVCASSLAGCTENLAPKMISTPSGPMGFMGTVIVDVDLKTGEITTEPVTSGALAPPTGVDAALYGSSTMIRHRFQLVGNAPSAGNTWLLSERIENLQPFAIGTHVSHASGVMPKDTMGVYVFLTLGPVVTGGCVANSPGCTVAVDSGYDGQFAFTDVVPQPYVYFKTILEATDGNSDSGLDFTNQTSSGGSDYFRILPFRASPGVTHFKFGVSVSAAFVKPNERSWTVHYAGDSLPNRLGTSLNDLRSEPDWRVIGSAVADTSITQSACPASSACLNIRNASPFLLTTDSLLYFRSDSLGQADSAFIDATISMSNLPSGNPSVYIGMRDPVKLIAFGIASDKVGFVSGANTFISGGSGSSAILSGEFRVTKVGSDSVFGYVNGIKVAKLSYASLPNATASTRPRYFWFGNRVTYSLFANPTNVTSRWSSVVYSIGSTSP